MDAKYLARKFQIKSRKVIRRYEELLRLSRIRARGWPEGEECRVLSCLEIACKSMAVPFDRPLATKMSGKPKVFHRSVASMRNVLNIHMPLTSNELCVKFGCVQLEAATKRVFARYKEQYLALVPIGARSQASFTGNLFIAVSFYLAARQSKVRLDRAKLRKLADCTEVEFANKMNSFLDLLPDLARDHEKRAKEKAAEGCEAASVLNGEELDIASAEQNPALADSKALKYQKWRNKQLEELRTQVQSVAKKRKTTQGALGFAPVEVKEVEQPPEVEDSQAPTDIVEGSTQANEEQHTVAVLEDEAASLAVANLLGGKLESS